MIDIGDNDLRVWELMLSGKWDLVHKTNLFEHLPAKLCENYFNCIGGFHPYDGDIVYLHSYADGIFAANLWTNKFVPILCYDKFDINPF